MNLRKAIIFITLVLPGLAVVGTSIYWGLLKKSLGEGRGQVTDDR